MDAHCASTSRGRFLMFPTVARTRKADPNVQRFHICPGSSLYICVSIEDLVTASRALGTTQSSTIRAAVDVADVAYSSLG